MRKISLTPGFYPERPSSLERDVMPTALFQPTVVIVVVVVVVVVPLLLPARLKNEVY
jgi:hypothetical protein